MYMWDCRRGDMSMKLLRVAGGRESQPQKTDIADATELQQCFKKPVAIRAFQKYIHIKRI